MRGAVTARVAREFNNPCRQSGQQTTCSLVQLEKGFNSGDAEEAYCGATMRHTCVLAPQALVQGSVVNIGSPAQMAYDGRAALWGSPRAAAAASPAAPPSIRPPLSVMQQNSADGALLLTAGAYSLLYSTDAAFRKVLS